MSTMQAAHRRSLWFNTSPSSSAPSEPLDFLKFNRYSTMPSASSIFERLQDMGESRPRASSKTAKDGKSERRSLSKKDTANLLGSPKRPPSGNSGLVGSIRGRLSRKRSSPLLSSHASSSNRSSILESPTTPTGPGLLSPMLGSPLDRYSLDDTLSPSNANFDASKVNYDGSTFRHLRRDSANDPTLHDTVDVPKGGYRPLALTKKGRRYIHPYPLEDAPTLRSYNKIDMENEASFNALLRRLYPKNAPVFHEIENPPAMILDLGCGQGFWVADASNYFAQFGTKVVGFDLVDAVSEEMQDLPSVSWKRGNLVSSLLPFKSETFDFVRISNMSDCIPQSRWQHVISEAYRVLKRNGRFEIIDDELMFPYASEEVVEAPEKSPSGSPKSSNMHTARSSLNSIELPAKAAAILGTVEGKQTRDYRASFLELDIETDTDGDCESISERTSIEPVPSLYRGHSPSEGSADSEYLPTPTEDEPLGESRWRTTSLSFTPPSPPPVSTSLCQDIEGIYETMLEGRYGINPRPHEFLLKLLLTTFGPGNSSLLRDHRLSLLPEILDDLVSSTKDSSFSKKARRIFSTKGEESAGPGRTLNDQVQSVEAMFERRSKAMKMLGINDSPPPTPPKPTPEPRTPTPNETSAGEPTESAETEEMQPACSRSSSSSSLPIAKASDQPSTPRKKAVHQPSGLFLHPDQFLDTSPRELEVYVTKHVHAVVGAQSALEEHALSLRADDGQPIVNEREWRKMMWEYECARCAHFNLPENIPLYSDEWNQADFTSRPRTLPAPVAQTLQKQLGITRRSSASQSSEAGPITLVRRIRVYEGIKKP